MHDWRHHEFPLFDIPQPNREVVIRTLTITRPGRNDLSVWVKGDRTDMVGVREGCQSFAVGRVPQMHLAARAAGKDLASVQAKRHRKDGQRGMFEGPEPFAGS